MGVIPRRLIRADGAAVYRLLAGKAPYSGWVDGQACLHRYSDIVRARRMSMKGFSPEYECGSATGAEQSAFTWRAQNKKQGEDYGDHDICGD